MLNSLLVSDLHLSSAPRDDYRFAVFDAIEDEQRSRNLARVCILGDLTDAKDYHSGKLVNRVCERIARLAARSEVHIVRGNHDGVDPEWPYFHFLRRFPGVWYYDAPFAAAQIGPATLVLPHSRDPDHDWVGIDFSRYEYVLMHATFEGAISESGIELPGQKMPRALRKSNAVIFSGDVHVPQKLGNVTYVGSPHPVRFGDSFAPRMIYFSKQYKAVSIPLHTIQRLMLDIKSVEDLEKVKCSPGDQAKVRIHLDETHLGKWQEMRQQVVVACRRKGLDVAAVELVRKVRTKPLLRARPVAARTPEGVLEDYLHQNKDADADVGRSLLNDAMEGK